jgi:hypothetical protein
VVDQDRFVRFLLSDSDPVSTALSIPIQAFLSFPKVSVDQKSHSPVKE